MEDKYKTSTFLTGLFCKFRLQDNNIRKIVAELYSPLIDSILKDVSEERRILLFKSLIPVIKNTISYFKHLDERDSHVDKEFFQIAAQLIEHSIYTTREMGSIEETNSTSQIFDNIMKQAFIDDIACDIGECIKLYRDVPQTMAKTDIIDRLTVLLTDYNVVMDTNLTLAGILESKVENIEDVENGEDELL